jgi:hypothetical protein
MDPTSRKPPMPVMIPSAISTHFFMARSIHGKSSAGSARVEARDQVGRLQAIHLVRKELTRAQARYRAIDGKREYCCL